MTTRTTKKRSKKATAKAPAKGPRKMYVASKVFKSTKSISVKQIPSVFSRADLEFIDVDHSGVSYEARVFVNNPSANDDTPLTEGSGYAGSFNIFGHGGCFGDVGHCDINQRRDDFDFRPSHPLLPIKKVVIATEAIKQAVAAGSDLTVTVVPVIKSWTDKTDQDDVLRFDHINLVTYD